MKGIILAGGAGTRLHPCTRVVSKQLMPVYDKPMIYYPLSVLMLAGIREVLVISTPHDLPRFRDLLEDGARLGMRFSYAEQAVPNGLPQAFVIGRDFLAGSPACLVLGDNLLFGNGIPATMRQAARLSQGGLIFAYQVQDPERYGVVSFDAQGTVTALDEKPQRPASRWAVPGLYCFGPDVCDVAARLQPSPRGETEILDLARRYLERGQLQVDKLGRGIAWLDTGTHDSLLQAGSFVETIQKRQGLQIACLEEIAWQNGWIGPEQVQAEAASMGKSAYAAYLWELLRQADRA